MGFLRRAIASNTQIHTYKQLSHPITIRPCKISEMDPSQAFSKLKPTAFEAKAKAKVSGC